MAYIAAVAIASEQSPVPQAQVPGARIDRNVLSITPHAVHGKVDLTAATSVQDWPAPVTTPARPEYSHHDGRCRIWCELGFWRPHPDATSGCVDAGRRPLQYSRQWGWALDTPFQWMKYMASHLGGIRNGPVVNWPGDIA
jgi:arylsulfatase A-like enzyme